MCQAYMKNVRSLFNICMPCTKKQLIMQLVVLLWIGTNDFMTYCCVLCFSGKQKREKSNENHFFCLVEWRKWFFVFCFYLCFLTKTWLIWFTCYSHFFFLNLRCYFCAMFQRNIAFHAAKILYTIFSTLELDFSLFFPGDDMIGWLKTLHDILQSGFSINCCR